jgi:predicted Zn-dependent protease
MTDPNATPNPAAPSKRLAYLEKVTRDGSTDPFPWYGLALEYRNLERYDESLQTFTTLRANHPGYVPMYLMCGQMLEKAGRTDDARAWLEAGITAAGKAGDSHARGELESALSTLG